MSSITSSSVDRYYHRVGDMRNFADSRTSKIFEYTEPIIPPSIGISTIDPNRVQEIDNFYIGVQLHRQQYKDRTGSLHPLKYFMSKNKNYNQLTWSYFHDYPIRYTEYKTPIVLPTTYERAIRLPMLPKRHLYGVHRST